MVATMRTRVIARMAGLLPALLAACLTLPAPAQTTATDTVYVAFDLETTGFSPERDRIIELAAIRFSPDGTVLSNRVWLIDPGQPIPPSAQAVHGITDAMVAGQPDFGATYPEFLAFASNAVLLAHNARFDRGFLAAEAARHQLPPPANPVIDTLPLARTRFPDAPAHSLPELAAWLKLIPDTPHRALADADRVRQLWLRLGE